MKLSEIAEYIADNYPESNIAYNNDVIKGCREESVSYTHLDVYKRQLSACLRYCFLDAFNSAQV